MELHKTSGIDQETYCSFISEYKTGLYRIAYGYLSDETGAMDAVDKAVYLGYLHRNDPTQYLKDPVRIELPQ